ncbi:MAG: hypothetical protein IJV38_12330 [Prevotella sp.]|nr:hypothetical protein [Prevotella sp.]
MGTILLKKYQFKGANAQSEGLWYPRVDHYSTIGTDELCQLASNDSHVERTEVKYVINAIVKQIVELVLMGHTIVIPELGTLSVSADGITVDDWDDVNCQHMIKQLKLNLRVTPEIRQALKSISMRIR